MAEDTAPPTDFVAPTIEELAPIFPAYEIEAFIAQGGMGAVYKARQRSLDRPVAIKILPREFGADASFRASFEAEAKAMARLNHPNLIAVYDFGDVDGMLFIVMEFVQGKALYYSARKKAIDPAVALGMVATISRALSHAHQGGIIHRDIKPANILLEVDATPKIGDFGLARPLDHSRSEGLTYGTPGYTAPEVYNRDHSIDQRADIFSVGALLYELISGKQPEPHSSQMATGADPRIDQILKKATHVSPSHRYMDALDFATDLEELIPKLSDPHLATSPQFQTQIGTVPIANPTIPGTQAALKSAKKHSSPLVPVLLLLSLLGVGALALLILNKKTKDPDSTEPVTTTTTKPEQKPKPKSQPSRLAEKKTNPTPTPETSAKPEKPKENPRKALARLRSDLVKGKRENFPPGTQERGGSSYFLVRQKMTWEQASKFAKRHGGQLANLPSKAALEWTHDSFKLKSSLWLGASDSGLEGKWFWTQGTPINPELWAPNEPNNEGKEDFACLLHDRPNLDDRKATEQLSFLIEWKYNPENQISIKSQLKRTAECLHKKKTPIFPAGTVNVGGSRFFLVQKTCTWSKANDLAILGGGHLAVISNKLEADFVRRLLHRKLKDHGNCWIGGHKSSTDPELWETVTGEKLAHLEWLPGQPDNHENSETHLTIKSQDGLIGFNDKADTTEFISHILIEWSHPSKRQTTPPPTVKTNAKKDTNKSALLASLEVVRKAVRDKHSRDYRRFRRKYDKVIKNFIGDAITRVNGTQKLTPTIRASIVERFKEFKDANELPEDLPKIIPKRIHRDLKSARFQIDTLWEPYEESFNLAKRDYNDRLYAAANKAIKSGKTDLGEIFTLEIARLEEDDKILHQILDGKKVPLPKREEDENKDNE